MRPKSQKIVVTFRTTTTAMAMETACMAAGLPGRLIPVPREITAGCGMAWSAPAEARADLEAFTRERAIPAQGWHELLL